MKKIALLSAIILFTFDSYGMEPKEQVNKLLDSNTTTLKLTGNVGTLNKLPNEMILNILFHAINWEEPETKKAFKHIFNVCLTCKDLNELVQKSGFRLNFEQKQCNTLLDEYKKKQEATMPREPYRGWKYDKSWNALHLAILKRDFNFLKETLPNLSKLKMLNVINEKINIDSPEVHHEILQNITPIRMLLVRLTDIPNAEKTELLNLFLSNGAELPPCYLYLEILLYFQQNEIALILLNKSNCANIMKTYLTYATDTTKEFIRKNHQCTYCKFE